MDHTLTEPASRLTHDLTPVFEDLKAFQTLKTLKDSALYKTYGLEIKRITEGIEWKNHTHVSNTPARIRVVAWNIERGLRLDGVIHQLQTHPVLSRADILLLTETDIGMGRSGNRNVPLEIADALDLNYCFANSFLAMGKGDIGEQRHTQPNTLALQGIAVFSRFKIRACKVVSLPPVRDLFDDLEKRLGGRKALICRIPIGGRDCDFAVIHLEPASTLFQRARQMEALLKALKQSAAPAQLIGGDWNTSTYNLLNRTGLARNLFYKFLFVGFNGAIAHYMTPERLFEKPLFDRLRTYGFEIDPYNDRETGTLYYDVNDPILNAKMRAYVPDFGLRWLHKKLRPWNGCVPLHLDWFAGRGFTPAHPSEGITTLPQTIERLTWQHQPLSDHNPIVVDVPVL